VTDLQYVRIRLGLSWHIIRSATRGGTWRTLCGPGRGTVLIDGSEVRDVLPGGKSCETCLRLARRSADAVDTAFIQAASEEAG